MDCLFCKMVKGDIPIQSVYEDDQILAFHDIDPQAPTHILIIPKQHISTANDLTSEHQALIGHMILKASAIAKELGHADDGYRIVNNCNSAGGQAVYHIHFHLLGGRTMTWPPG